MATLTETARISRMVIKVGGIALVVMMVGRFLVDGFARYWKATHPAALPPPNIALGPLPPIVFPDKQKPELTYQLELPTGQMPSFDDRMKVYLMPVKRPKLGALNQSTEDAVNLGFRDKPQARSDVVYRFAKSQPLPTTLDMDIYTGKFTYTVDWPQDPNFFAVKELPSDTAAVDEAKTYLQQSDLVPKDIADGQAQITYLKASGSNLKRTVSASEADFVQADLFRAPIEKKYETVTPDPSQGVIRVIFSGNRNQGRIVKINYNYYAVDYTTSGEYPLITPETAWTELLAGKGYVAQLNPGITKVIVRRVGIAYYDAFEPQPYMQPVYVFKGDDNFVAYVPAIPPPTATGVTGTPSQPKP
jgi:hypothetical protein